MADHGVSNLVSVGYEGGDADSLIGRLKRERVRSLVDVRLNPVSRKPGLSKRRLSEALLAEGITYVHYRELGNPKDNREGFRAGSREARQRFEDVLDSGPAGEALQHVSELLDDGTVALLCFERDHNSCHRGIVADAIVRERPGVAVVAI